MPETVINFSRRENLIHDEELEPGQYLQYRKTEAWGDKMWASARCPSCKELTCITRENHSVNAKGEVYPALKCPFTCGLQAWIVLDDWKPEPVGSA